MCEAQQQLYQVFAWWLPAIRFLSCLVFVGFSISPTTSLIFRGSEDRSDWFQCCGGKLVQRLCARGRLGAERLHLRHRLPGPPDSLGRMPLRTPICSRERHQRSVGIHVPSIFKCGVLIQIDAFVEVRYPSLDRFLREGVFSILPRNKHRRRFSGDGPHPSKATGLSKPKKPTVPILG